LYAPHDEILGNGEVETHGMRLFEAEYFNLSQFISFVLIKNVVARIIELQ